MHRCVLLLLFLAWPSPLYAAHMRLFQQGKFQHSLRIDAPTVQRLPGHPAYLRIAPDPWHGGRLRIDRSDFSRFSCIEFRLRSRQGEIRRLPFKVFDYFGTSKAVDLAHYAGGRIGTDWQRVRIPLQALMTKDYHLDNVTVLAFSPPAPLFPYEIEQIRLLDLRGPVFRGYEVRSDKVVSLKFSDVDLAAARQLPSTAFTVTSRDDPRFRVPIVPFAVGFDRITVAVDSGGSGLTNETRIHLVLPLSLRTQRGYTISVHGLQDDAGNSPDHTRIVFRPTASVISPSIHVNQVGYARHAPKVAFVGNWLGDLGPMPLTAGPFTVIDAASGRAVFQGTLQLRAAHDPQSGEDVYVADFSSVTQPGRYYLRVAGLIGRSYTFRIADDVYDPVYRAVMRVFYHRRNTDIGPPFADSGQQRRGIPSRLNGVFHPALRHYPLSNGEQPHAFKQVVKGWFDAGDYGQYINNAAPVWAHIGFALDVAGSGHFRDGELHIPESGNGIPDVLDELAWGSEWAMSMQDARDGGVYHKIASGHWDRVLPGEIDKPRFIYEKTTSATANMAAMMAIYARLIRPYNASAAERASHAARLAWRFVQRHPTWPAEGEGYHPPARDADNGDYTGKTAIPARLWAAAELYRLTGEAQYQQAFLRLWAQYPQQPPWPALWAYLCADHPNRDVRKAQQAKRMLLARAKLRRTYMDRNPYMIAKHTHIPFSGWGNVGQSSRHAIDFLLAFAMTGDRDWLRRAWLSLNAQLGANPLSLSYIVGVGAHAVRDPLDMGCKMHGSCMERPPLKGVPVFGPIWHLPAYKPLHLHINQAYYPAEAPTPADNYAGAYPVLRRFVDARYVIPMAEWTLREASAVAVVFGLLRDDRLLLHPLGGCERRLADDGIGGR